MLPDYPKVKERIKARLLAVASQVESQEMGILSGGPGVFIKEGNRHSLHREDGSSDEIEIQTITHKFVEHFDFEHPERMSPETIIGYFIKMGQAFGVEKAKLGIQVVMETAEKVGNVETSEKPLPEKILSCLEKIDMSFNSDGRPGKHSFLANPEQAKPLMEAMKTILTTPDMLKRHHEIMAAKREQHRDREAARKLVD